ncbi:MAG: saccharopine dehydrogenase C-terminal domain-containing protein [Candidatus Neomarinimicrobiota bacterium]
MGKKIVVLGAGLVGKTMIADLNNTHDVTAVDVDNRAIKMVSEIAGVKAVKADLSDPQIIRKVIKDCDIVIGAIPGFMGFATLKTVIEIGKDIVDISFFPEDVFVLDELAKKNNVTAVVDCGVAPGMSNIILGYYNARMAVNAFECLVGGLPIKREWPWEYKAVFSPLDVIEEYLRPARFVLNGQLVTKEALSGAELVEFEELGTLEALNSDGLRSLLKTMDIPNMIEKTMRYPGTIEYVKVLRDTGFFSYDLINVGDKQIRPIDLTAELLFPKWKMGPGEADVTAMKLSITGKVDGQDKTVVYKLVDRFDPSTNTSSMARTTGYTCTAVVQLLLSGKYSRTGISPPEYVGTTEENFQFILNYLKDRGVIYKVIAE